MAPAVDLVIFGATGDLSRRKILPSLGALVAREGMKLRVIGAGRSHDSTDQFRDLVKEASGSQSLPATAEWVTLRYSAPTTFGPVNNPLTGPPSPTLTPPTPPAPLR